MIFRSSDKKFAVNLPLHIQGRMETHCIKSGINETGGIIIGKYERDNSLATIIAETGPPTDSSSGPTWFVRGTKGLKKILDRNWRSGHYYLGEWHFHPYASPKPSWQDINQMRDIAKSKVYNCPEPILIIIGGSKKHFSIMVFISLGKGPLIELYPQISI